VETGGGRGVGGQRAVQADLIGLADDIIAQVVPLIASRARTAAPTDTGSVEQITTASPEAYRHFVAGEIALRGGEGEDALRQFKAATQLDSTFALAWARMADVHLNFTRFTPAGECADRAWSLRTRLGIKDRMMLESRRLQLDFKIQAAMDVYREMLARWPDDRVILRTYGSALYWHWMFAEGQAVAEQGLACYPDDEELGETRCAALTRRGRTAEAKAAALDYQRRHPGTAIGWELLGEAQLAAGEADSAEAALRKARSLDPDDYSLQHDLARCATVRGQAAEAEAIVERLLARSDLTATERWLLMTPHGSPGMASLCAATGRLRRALEWVDASGRLDGPDGPDEMKAQTLSMRTSILFDAGRPREALAAAQELGQLRNVLWVRNADKEPRIRSLVQLDSLVAARKALAEYLAVKGWWHPRQARYGSLSVLAELQLAEGHPDSALATLMRNEEGAQLEARGQNTRARALRTLGRLPEAAATLEGLLKRNGCRFIARYQLGQIYEEMGRKADAAREYEVFLKAWANADPGWPQVEDARRRLAALRVGH
jgi:tetratricopeptide (TPR) repeat protein